MDNIYDPKTSNNRIHIIMAVWSRLYLDLFLNISLPSQFSKGNLPAISGIKGILYKIYTRKIDEAYIREHPCFAKLSSLVETIIISVDELNTDDKFSPLIKFHNRAIKEADHENACTIFLSPDFVLADGMLSRLIYLKCIGYHAVMILTLRLVMETAMPDLLNLFCRPEEQCFSASPMELTRAALPHLHPIEKSYFWGSGFSNFPIHAYWPVGNRGLLARCYYLHPIMINPIIRFVTPKITIDADYIDLSCPCRSDIHIVRSSREMACFELTQQACDDINARSLEKFPATPFNYAKWAVKHSNPVYSSTIHHGYFQTPILIGSKDDNPATRHAKRDSAGISRWVRLFTFLLRKHSGVGDALSFIVNTRAESKPRSRRVFDLHGEFKGYGWGEAEENIHGQKWRWIGKDNKAVIAFRMTPGNAYAIKTHIHTAANGSINKLIVEVNGHKACSQHISRRRGLLWHHCVVPGEHLLGSDYREDELMYRIEGKEEGDRIALTRTVLSPLSRNPMHPLNALRLKLPRFLGKLAKRDP